MKTFLSIFSIAVVAILVAVPTVAQNNTNIYNPPGFYVNWVINLHPANAVDADGGSGIAQFYSAAPSIHHTPIPVPSVNANSTVYTRLTVECEYLTSYPVPVTQAPLYVFVGPGRSPGEPFGKLVGQMQANGGSATWSTLRPPLVKKGTTVTIVRNGVAIMQGKF